MFHAFSGDAAMARECVEAGYVLSFPGVITFRNAPGLRAAAAVAPIDQVLVETDAPFLTPHPFRGRPNAPRLLPLHRAGPRCRRPARPGRAVRAPVGDGNTGVRARQLTGRGSVHT